MVHWEEVEEEEVEDKVRCIHTKCQVYPIK
jgi:hypothetical protein